MTELEAKSLALLNLQKRDDNACEEEHKGDRLRATLITPEEIENIMMGLMCSRLAEGRGCTTEELQTLINKVISTRYYAGLSEMAGKGLTQIRFDGVDIEYEIRPDLEPEIKAEMIRRANEVLAKAAQA